MADWITVTTFMYSHQVYAAKAKLESEGIDVLLKDELASQMYSCAIGIQLQVEEQNVEKSLQILTECGYL